MAGGALSWTLPTFLARTWDALGEEALDAAHPVTGREGPVLVVLQMAGGNDGLNTIVPIGDDDYHRARPRIGVAEREVLRIRDGLGFHPALKGPAALLDSGHLAVVQGVGYPNPNRSHFRSTEIWQTASEANRYESHGWIGRYFDHACNGSDPAVGVNVGRQMPQAFRAARPAGISLDPGRLGNFDGRFADAAMPETSMVGADDEASGGTIGDLAGNGASSGNLLDFLDRTALDARVSSAEVHDILRRPLREASYPATRLGQALRLVGRLIGGGLPARVYYVSQGGYDTHTQQEGTHARLLQEFGDAIHAFVDDLKAQGNLERVLGMTFSEFGRRVAENASGGTDHGAAGPIFLFGRSFRASILGRMPSLAPAALLNGDPRFTIDFRSVYAAVLDKWLRTSSETILGRRFEPLRMF